MHEMIRAEARRLANTVIWSWDGFRAAWATEKTLRQWTLANVLSAALASLLDLTPGERALILALGLLVLAAELINTALEEVVDLVSPETHPRAKKAKDCGSACVALARLQ
ncbi:MAG: diacylglycerol kinase [Pseudomonadota bacterium]